MTMLDKSKVLRVAVIGPESSGKSVLCENLAKHYNTVWVPEYSRTYLPALSGKYSDDDIIKMYMHQFEQEQRMMSDANRIIFTDTEFIIAKVWMEHVFGTDSSVINKMITDYPYDFYLLTSPDLPWQPDPLRENPGKGEFFFQWYRQLLDEFGFPYGIVSGVDQNRLESAVLLIDKLISTETNG